MTKMVDKVIFYILGLVIIAVNGINYFSVIIILSGAIFSCLYYLWEEKQSVWLLPFIYLIFCFIDSGFLAFVPLIVYDTFRQLSLWLLSLYIIPWFLNISISQPIFLTTVIIFSMFAFVLKNRCLENQKLDNAYRLQRDQSQEVSMLLTRQNKDILLQKDYEVQVAILSERNRIAREIHDNAGHSLSSSLLQVGALQAINQQDNMKIPLNNLKNTLSESLENIRANVHDMQDDALNLEVAINKIVRSYAHYQINFLYDIYSLEDIQLKYTIINILKEAMHNIYKHSNATKIEILLREQPVFYQFIIKDNGHVEEIKEGGMGLKNMRERIEQYKGYINFKTENGFEIFITIPKKEA